MKKLKHKILKIACSEMFALGAGMLHNTNYCCDGDMFPKSGIDTFHPMSVG